MNSELKKSSFQPLANEQVDRITFKRIQHYKGNNLGSFAKETEKLPIDLYSEADTGITEYAGLLQRTLTDRRAVQDKLESEKLLHTAEAEFRSLVEQIPGIAYIASLDHPGKLLYLSPQIDQLGFPPGYWLDEPHGWLNRIHADDRLDAIEAFAHTYVQHAPLCCKYRLVKSDGQVRWFLDKAVVARDESGQGMFLKGMLLDITKDEEIEQEHVHFRRHLDKLVAQRTEQIEKQCALLKLANTYLSNSLTELRQSNSALRSSEQRFRLLLESAGEGILGLDAEGRCTFVNQAALRMLGYDREELIDQAIHAKLNQSGAENVFHEGIPQRCNEIFRCKDGSSFQAECSSYPIELEGRIDGVVLVFWDVTESQLLMQNLAYQASHDPLTGLINRTEFERRLARVLASANEEQSEHVLCYLDLDHFKFVNDSCGHEAGDELLRELGRLLKSTLRQRDTLARLGGDEFALLLEHSRIDQALGIANELCESVPNFNFIWDGKSYSVGVSIGMVPLASAGIDVKGALSAADSACYLAKAQGRNRVHVFNTQDNIAAN